MYEIYEKMYAPFFFTSGLHISLGYLKKFCNRKIISIHYFYIYYFIVHTYTHTQFF